MAPTYRILRIYDRLQLFWNDLRGDKPMPFESQVNPDAIRELWPHCFLLEAADSGLRFDYMGAHILEAYGDVSEGAEIYERLFTENNPKLLVGIRTCIAEAKPNIDEGEFTNNQGRTIRYRACLLPLASEGRPGVQFVLGGMKWKAF
jgi:hypothetical protein